jgi:hypothetical protein
MMKTQNYLAILKVGVVASAIAPAVAFGAVSDCSSVSGTGLVGLFRCAGGLVDMIVALLIALALMLFLWGVAKFMTKADDQKAREEGRQFMIWGIIALFVMVAAWQLAGVISRTFGFSSSSPQLNSSSLNSRAGCVERGGVLLGDGTCYFSN